MRIRTKDSEIMCTPDKEFNLIVVQETEEKKKEEYS